MPAGRIAPAISMSRRHTWRKKAAPASDATQGTDATQSTDATQDTSAFGMMSFCLLLG
jgi:hypothetical protein